MNFPVNIYLLALLAGTATTAFSLPLWRRWCGRAGLVDDPGQRKIHDRPMPLAGGLAVLTGLVVPLVCLAVVQPWDLLGEPAEARLEYGVHARWGRLLVIVVGAGLMTGLGLLDDRLELRPALKFAGQCGVALGVAAAGIRVTLFVPSLLFSYAATMVWILAVTNAFNFMDNMNGLCAGLGVIGALWFGFAAAIQAHYLVAAFAFLTAGTLLGFLPWNYPRARAFLGDSGSHLAGYLLAVLAILPHFYSTANPRPLAVISPLLVLAVPLADLAWVVVLRWRAGRPFYLGDTNHLSHRLVRRGFRPAVAVALIWTIAAAVGSVSLLLM